jgi:hypothetical protein
MSGAATRIEGETLDQPAETATHFAFQHKVFRFERAYFCLDSRSEEPVFHVQLGDLDAVLPFSTVRQEFSIEPDSSDGKLLDVVAKGLRYVKAIRPGDSIPRELLDGTASWSVEERHHLAAKRRIVTQLAALLEDDGGAVEALLQPEVDGEARKRLQDVIGEIAEATGIGRDKRQTVIDRVEGFAREYSYVEALRDRSGELRKISAGLAQLARAYKSDPVMLQEVMRVQSLIRSPTAEIEGIFGRLDQQTADLTLVLKNYQSQVALVRRTRDDLHFRLRAWDEVIPKWHDEDMCVSPRTEQLVKETYRFAAFNFPQTKDWKRQ